MEKVNFKTMLLSIALLSISCTVITSCDKDEPKPTPQEKPEKPKPAPQEKPTPQEKTANFLIGTTIKNADGMSGSSYMQLITDFSGSIDNSKATQIGFATSVAVRGKDLFVFPTFGKDADHKLYKYTYTGTTTFGTATTLILPPNSGVTNMTMVNDDKMYVPAYNVAKVFIINPKTMKKTGEIDLSKYAHKDNTPEPSNGIIRDGLYYLCLDQIGTNYMPYEDYHQVNVAIIDIQKDTVLKVISEKVSNLSFPTRPMEYTKGMIFTDEQNDIYIACVGKFGFDPKYLNNGFVCIPAEKKEFDTSKSWDISTTPIEGTSYKPSSIFNCRYIGNGKLVAYVGIIELLDPNNPYTTRNSMAVVIDLKAKSIKQIKGIPLTDGHSIPIDMYKDLVIIGSYGKDKAGFFSYNPKTEEVKHVVSTTGNPSFFHYFE